MRRSQAVQSVLAEILQTVEGLERPAMVRIMPILMQAHNELEGDLLKWLGRQDGNATFTAQRYRNALVQVRRAVTTLRKMQPVVLRGLKDAARTAGAISVANVEREWMMFSRIFEGSVQPIALDASLAINDANQTLIPRFKSSAARYTAEVRESITRELAVSRVRGETIHEASERLTRRIPLLRQSARHWADRLARTETMNAYATYHMNGIAQLAKGDSEVMARWDATLDRRACPQCGSLDGKIIAVGGKWEASWSVTLASGELRHFSSVHKQPPAHPNCRCVPTPWKLAWGDYPEVGNVGA